MSEPSRVVFYVRSEPHNLLFLGEDKGGFFIRNFYIRSDGKAHSNTIPLTAEDLRVLGIKLDEMRHE